MWHGNGPTPFSIVCRWHGNGPGDKAATLHVLQPCPLQDAFSACIMYIAKIHNYRDDANVMWYRQKCDWSDFLLQLEKLRATSKVNSCRRDGFCKRWERYRGWFWWQWWTWWFQVRRETVMMLGWTSTYAFSLSLSLSSLSLSLSLSPSLPFLT